MRCCPCLRWAVDKISSKPKKKAYEGAHEFEEEQFMNPQNREEASGSDRPSLSDTLPASRQSQTQTKASIPLFEDEEKHEREEESDLLNFKMEIKATPKASPPAQQAGDQQVDIEDLIRQQLEQTPEEAIQKSERESEADKSQSVRSEPQALPQEVLPNGFSLNLDPLDPYFGILHEKTSNIEDYLKKDGASVEVGNPNSTGLQVKMIEGGRSTSFILTYQLNCSYSFYQGVFKNDKMVSSMSPFIAESKTIEAHKANLTRNTLKFRKIASLEARDCFYVKYHNSAPGQHWQVYLNDDKHPPSNHHKTCEVFCVKNIHEHEERQLKVTEYLEVDLQVSNPASIIGRLVNQFRNFLNSIHQHVESTFTEELV